MKSNLERGRLVIKIVYDIKNSNFSEGAFLIIAFQLSRKNKNIIIFHLTVVAFYVIFAVICRKLQLIAVILQ